MLVPLLMLRRKVADPDPGVMVGSGFGFKNLVEFGLRIKVSIPSEIKIRYDTDPGYF